MRIPASLYRILERQGKEDWVEDELPRGLDLAGDEIEDLAEDQWVDYVASRVAIRHDNLDQEQD